MCCLDDILMKLGFIPNWKAYTIEYIHILALLLPEEKNTLPYIR